MKEYFLWKLCAFGLDTFACGRALKNYEKPFGFLERGAGYKRANVFDFFGRFIFVFGGDFGVDTVEQLADGKVTLYFESQTVKYDESAKTFSDGRNSVTFKGNFEFEVIYGTDKTLASIGAYDDFSSEKIFEDKLLIAWFAGNLFSGRAGGWYGR